MTKKKSKIREPNKQDISSIILGILQFMSEQNISKDWLLQEVKKHRIKGIRPIMGEIEILRRCPPQFISDLYDYITNQIPPGPRPRNLPPTKHLNWFYTDVVASSNPKITTKEQVHKIMVLNDLISRTESFKKQNPKSRVILPSGDGYAIGFDDSIESPLKLAIELHTLLNAYNHFQKPMDRVYIRSGIESGIVYFMKDLNGNNTVWGPGIIMARRVMDLGEKMHVLTSEGIAKVLSRLSPEYKSIMHQIGKYPVKWEGEIELNNIYEEGKFGNRIPPQKPPESPKTNFTFESVKLILDVKNPKTWATHHTQLWNLLNVSNEPRDIISYKIEGDKPKKFEDLNVSVKDGNGKKLKILGLDAKNPTRKTFTIKLDKPIKPNSSKFLKLEWDWEETNRNYVYEFSSECKKFRYEINIANEKGLKVRVLKVDLGTGFAEFATPPPDMRHENGVTHISWARNNIQPYESYKIEW